MTEARSKSMQKYLNAKTVEIKLRLVKTTDADILERLEMVGNKQGYIKTLIRADIRKSE